ncbi:hypothetical protein [Agathobacter sp.]
MEENKEFTDETTVLEPQKNNDTFGEKSTSYRENSQQQEKVMESVTEPAAFQQDLTTLHQEVPEQETTIQPDTYESPELEPQRSNLKAMPVTPEFKGWRPNLGDNPIQPQYNQQAQIPPVPQPVQPNYYGQAAQPQPPVQPQYDQQPTSAYTQPQYNNQQASTPYAQPKYAQQPASAYTQPQYNQQPTSTYTQPQYTQQPASPYAQPQYNQQAASPYTQSPYSQPTPPVKEKGDSIGFGIASMVLGIASVLLFCTCFNIVTAILAVIFGIIQLVKNKNKVFAIVGISTAAVSIILTVIFWVAVGNDLGNSYNPYDNNYWYYRYYDLQDDIY